jgi:hypothetical protein
MTDRDDASELEEELHTRRGQFLKVQKVGDQYKETSLRGKTTTYSPDAISDICITGLTFHTRIDISNGTVWHYATGRTSKEVRAIGTEGNYRILDVILSPETPVGTSIITSIYANDGHSLHTSMRVGLSEDAITALKREDEIGDLKLNRVSGSPLYFSVESILLDYWRNHVVQNEDGSDNIRAEWIFKFESATYSPEGYIAFLGSSLGSSTRSRTTDVRIANKVSFQFSEESERPLKSTLDTLAASITSYSKIVSWGIVIVVVAIVILILRTH